MTDAVRKVENKAQEVEDHPGAAWAAAAGHVVNGIVHALIGLIAIGVAQGGGGSADQGGAMEQIGASPLGVVALWVCAVALFGLGIYMLAIGIGEVRKELTDALKNFGRAVAYFAVGGVALNYALGGTSDSEETTSSISATLLESTLGSILLFVVGLAVLAVGVYLIVKGVRKKFLEDVKTGARTHKWFTILGITGYVAKGLSVAAIGVLFIVAVLTSDADAASGMDGALKSFIGLPFGQVLLIAIGVGLITYGVFCLAKARKVKPS